MNTKSRPLSDGDFDAFKAFVSEFKSESDRAAVILGATKLDLLLYQVLQRFLKPSTSGRGDELLDGDSPIGTFSAKISLAHRLGLIDDDFCRALHLIRKIRNSFAHELGGISLDTGGHRDRIREIVAPLKDDKAFHWLLKRYFGEEDKSAFVFRGVVAFLSVRLEGLEDGCPSIMWKPLTMAPPAAPDGFFDERDEAKARTNVRVEGKGQAKDEKAS